MKPIINPWIFYFANVCDNIIILLVILFALSLFLTLIFIGVTHIDSDTLDDEELKKYSKSLKVSIICAVITGIMAIFCPESETVYKMVIASQLTEDNLNKGKESAKELIDYIIERVNEMDKKGEE